MRIHLPHLPIERIIVGQVAVSASPKQVSTLVGSCITACLFDCEAQVGGMNHFLLPESPRGARDVNNVFGVHAMETLISGLLRAGAAKRRLQAKLFGGCKSQLLAGPHWQAGEANQQFALRELRRHGIPLRAHSLGGRYGRQVCLATHSGEVRMRVLHGGSAASSPAREIVQA